MNQQRPADAQKYFAQALEADPKFAVARLNLGVALLGQQKLEAARAALTDATVELPNDPHGWYNLGLALKDSGEPEKGIVAFRRVTEIAPNEADAYYFIGYLSTQLQKYDDAIAAFEKGLELNPVHASAEFGLARALQRKGDTEAARQHLARFQKITSEHLGTPFGAGYGDQGKFSTAELPVSTAMEVPPAIAVHFAPEARPFVSKSSGGIPVAIGASTGACFFDFDGDGQPDLFLVNGATNGASHLLRNLGNGRFEDITQAAGIRLAGSGLGCPQDECPPPALYPQIARCPGCAANGSPHSSRRSRERDQAGHRRQSQKNTRPCLLRWPPGFHRCFLKQRGALPARNARQLPAVLPSRYSPAVPPSKISPDPRSLRRTACPNVST